jgi:hypothetical protein
MSRYFISTSLIILLLNCQAVNAQITPGYIIGINRSSLSINSGGLTSGPETVTGIHFGGVLDMPLNKFISFQPNLLFTAKGSNFSIDSTEYSLSPIYIEVPLYFVFSFGSEYLAVSLSAGPYIACGVGGYKIISGGEMQDLKYGSGNSKDLKAFDAGFDLGAGINIGGIVISAHYEIGLANLMPVHMPDSEMKNKVWAISISSLFAFK